MPRNALRCSADITLHAVTCPGVWLPRRDSIYISVCMFGQVRRSTVTSPVFPLLFHEKFCFDKVFYSAFEPSQVACQLDNHYVTIEVVQMSDIYDGGRLLASYEGTVRDFLYPYPSYSPCYGTQDREVLLNRSLDFPGISPKLEFSTRTVIAEAGTYCDDDLVYTPRTVVRGRSRSRSRSRARARSPRGKTYGRPTIASISRSRSLSPSRRLADLCLDDTEVVTDSDLKPPFVVRKCDSSKLIGRMPGHPGPASIHGRSRQRRKSLPSGLYDDDYLYNIRPVSPVTKYSFDDDLTLSRPYSTSYRATSPYRYSLYDDYYYPRTADVINTRVERAIARNKSLERLDRLERSANTRYYEALTDLELDLALARARTRRTYYY